MDINDLEALVKDLIKDLERLKKKVG